MPVDHARSAETLPEELRFTARLGLPLALGELGWMSTYIVDALMIGRLPHSALSIAASSLGNTIFSAIAFCAIGLQTGIETLVSQEYGSGQLDHCSRTLAQSLWFVLLSTPVVMLLSWAAIPLLPYFGTPPDIVAETRRYMNALVWSAGPLLLYWTLRRYLQSVNRVLWIMLSLITAGAVNFLGDYAFLYGHLGAPALGIAGSGWATCIVRIFTASLLVVAILTGSPALRLQWSWQSFHPDWRRLRRLWQIGWPTALQSLTDLGVSTYMSILCSRLGTTLLAAHQVVLDLDAFVYMVPLGLSYATAARVGQSAGRKSPPQIRRAAQASLLLGLGFVCLSASVFAGFRYFWAGLYTNDSAVVAAAAPIFLICALLQFGDAGGILFEAAMVGVGDTRTPLFVGAAWYWAIGMPIGYWLTFHHSGGLAGLWFGRAVAAVGSALTLAFFWHRRMRPAQADPPPKARRPRHTPLFWTHHAGHRGADA